MKNELFKHWNQIDLDLISNLTDDELQRFIKLKTASFELQAKVHKLETAANQILSDCLDRLHAEVDAKLAEKEKASKRKASGHRDNRLQGNS